MNNVCIWFIILVGSLIIGLLKYLAANDGGRVAIFLSEFLNHVLGIFIGGSIVYYFVYVRYPLILRDGGVSTLDLILMFVVATCFFGWLPYFIKNFTLSIEKIIARILR